MGYERRQLAVWKTLEEAHGELADVKTSARLIEWHERWMRVETGLVWRRTVQSVSSAWFFQRDRLLADWIATRDELTRFHKAKLERLDVGLGTPLIRQTNGTWRPAERSEIPDGVVAPYVPAGLVA